MNGSRKKDRQENVTDPSFVSRLHRRRIISRISSRIDLQSNLRAWHSQETALVGHHRSRTFGREATARHLTWIRTSSRRGTTSGLATWRAVFCFAKSHPNQSLAGAACHRPTPERQRPTALYAIASRQQHAHPLRPLYRPLR